VLVLLAVIAVPSNGCHRFPPPKPFEPMTNNGWPHNTPAWCGTQRIPEAPDHPSRKRFKALDSIQVTTDDERRLVGSRGAGADGARRPSPHDVLRIERRKRVIRRLEREGIERLVGGGR
jgi:hypothetical protein